jgi:hypothetical protein
MVLFVLGTLNACGPALQSRPYIFRKASKSDHLINFSRMSMGFLRCLIRFRCKSCVIFGRLTFKSTRACVTVVFSGHS